MLQFKSFLALAALLGGGLLLGSCGGDKASDTSTNTPSSTLGTDSAATKMGGTAPDTTSTMAPPTGASTSASSTGQQPK